ncbi:MAG TPA: sigma-70 family RNA polymerase sigma factor [Candidatus Angelobacter sp.]|nr:sigma-70 family RNA polymerase sigma factor [Candidatus Angelobacter sp.]
MPKSERSILHAPPLHDRELVELCLHAGDETEKQWAWRELLRRFQPEMARVIYRSLRHWMKPTATLVDDLVAETYVKIVTNESKALQTFDYRHENSLGGFLKTIAANVCEDYRRSRQCEKRGWGKEEQELTETPACADSSVPQKLDQDVLFMQIDQILQGCASTRDRSIFWLYFKQGFAAREISELMSPSITTKNVENILARLVRVVSERLHGAAPKNKGREAAIQSLQPGGARLDLKEFSEDLQKADRHADLKNKDLQNKEIQNKDRQDG